MKSAQYLSRLAALEILNDILLKNQPLDEALDLSQKLPGLDYRDRAFARNLISTTLRRLGQIDAVIHVCLNSPLPAKANDAQQILRLGICQLLFLDTQPHAAVNTSVEIAQKIGQGPYKKLINAILRRVSRESKELLEDQDEAWLNTPEWLWNGLQDGYGDDICRQITSAHLKEASLDIFCKPDPKHTQEHWQEALGGTALPMGGIRLEGAGNVTKLAGFDEGAWWVQDAAASLPALLFKDISGKSVIDLCAAPGGKTAQLACAGAHVTSVDRSEKRLERLRDNIKRLNLSVDIVCADATNWQPDALADAILIDAPCSATGTIRRHPDLPYLKGGEDVSKLANLQEKLLKSATQMVKPGGEIVYCTCSLLPAEGEDQIANLLRADPSLEIIPIGEHDIPGIAEFIQADGSLRTFPHHMSEAGGLDGFFIQKLKKLS